MKVVEPVKKKLTKKVKEKLIKAGIEKMQRLTGVTVRRAAVCQGIFPKPYHVFYIAKSVSGVEIRYEIETQLERDLGENEIIIEVIRNFQKHANKVN